jgi:protein O-GlcNAc transferase
MLRAMTGHADAIERHLGSAQQAFAQGDLEAAESAARSALAFGDEITVLALLGLIEHRRGRAVDAVGWFDRALVLAPDDARLRANRAASRLGAGDVAGAEADAEVAVRFDPAHFGAWLNLGLAREALGRSLDSIEPLERAHALRPDDVPATRALARCLYHSGTGHRRCRDLLQALLARDPDDWMARLFLANSQVNDAEIEPALRDFERLMQAHPAFHQAHSTWLIAMQYDPRTTPAQLLEAHRAWARQHAPAPTRPRPVAKPRGARPMRVGWLSPRFGAGPMASFVLPVLEAIEPEQCEHVLYATHPPQGAFGDRFRALATQWRTFSRESPDEVADRIRADELDVLVDLAGHAPGNRLRALALGPAPVQVSWGDYFSTTGVPGIDVFLSDDWLSPPGAEADFSERLVRLPSGRHCFHPPEPVPEPMSRSAAAPVFACFNRVSKLNDAVLRAWGRILAACPSARLQLRAGSFDDPEARAFFFQRATACGLDPVRVDLRGFAPYAELMRAYQDVDIALDPFPFSGCATSCDALWMGVPVVTLAGQTLVSRQTAALLGPIGLEDLIAQDAESYVDVAVRLAHDAERRRGLRADLRARMQRQHVPKRFASDLLDTLRALRGR